MVTATRRQARVSRLLILVAAMIFGVLLMNNLASEAQAAPVVCNGKITKGAKGPLFDNPIDYRFRCIDTAPTPDPATTHRVIRYTINFSRPLGFFETEAFIELPNGEAEGNLLVCTGMIGVNFFSCGANNATSTATGVALDMGNYAVGKVSLDKKLCSTKVTKKTKKLANGKTKVIRKKKKVGDVEAWLSVEVANIKTVNVYNPDAELGYTPTPRIDSVVAPTTFDLGRVKCK